MKKLLLLLFIACTAFSCSKSGSDDNTVRYDETKGYLSNLASAKYGIVGRWKIITAVTYHYEYKADGTRCKGSYLDTPLTSCDVSYEVIQKGAKYYIKSRNNAWPLGEYAEYEIFELNKAELIHAPREGETEETRLGRVSTAPAT